MAKHCGTQEIVTDRLILRRFSDGDAEAMFSRWMSDEVVYRHMSSDPIDRLEGVRDYLSSRISRYESPSFYWWAVVPREGDGLPVGFVSLTEVRGSSANLAYCLSSGSWGRGYATEAGRAVVDYIFGGTGIKTLHGSHFVENTPSGRVLIKCGFFVTGRSTGRLWHRDRYRYCDCYKLTKRVYLKNKRAASGR